MKRAGTKILAGTALLACVILVAGIVGAKATKTTLTGCAVVTGGGWEEWREGGNIAHGRGTWYYNVYDDSDTQIGTGFGVVNVSFNMETINGVEWGTMTFDLTEGGLGTFEGRFREKITASYLEGQVVLHGTGDSAGLMAKST